MPRYLTAVLYPSASAGVRCEQPVKTFQAGSRNSALGVSNRDKSPSVLNGRWFHGRPSDVG